jgi:glycosyltransferase involved in cell wall biosynthesis
MANPDLSVIIPCFNERENIRLLLPQLQKLIDESSIKIEAIVVDGNSQDGTKEILQSYIESQTPTNIKCVLQARRLGYGADIMYGVKISTGELICWTHADMQTDIADVIKAFDVYKSCGKQNIVVKGKRVGRGVVDAFFTFGMQIVVWLVLGVNISDINAQPKLFSREFYQAYLQQNYPTDFALDLDLLHKAIQNGYKIVTFPVVFAKRTHGEAKGGGSIIGKFKLIKRTISYIFALKRMATD